MFAACERLTFSLVIPRRRTENERQMAAASAPPPADEPLSLDEEHPPNFKPDGSGKDKVRMLSQRMV